MLPMHALLGLETCINIIPTVINKQVYPEILSKISHQINESINFNKKILKNTASILKSPAIWNDPGDD